MYMCTYVTGEGAIHLAIEKNNYAGVKHLLKSIDRKPEVNPLVNMRARGRFFMPEDQLKKLNEKESDYDGLY